MMSLLKAGLVVVFFLSGCANQKQQTNPTLNRVGPINNNCPKSDESILFRRGNNSKSHYANCFNINLSQLSEKGLITSKANWLKHFQNTDAAINFLNSVSMTSYATNESQQMLAKMLVTKGQWKQALEALELIDRGYDKKLYAKIESTIASQIIENNKDLLPSIYSITNNKFAQVKENKNIIFDLVQIDDGHPKVLNGEPSMASSKDGKNIWFVWTDNSSHDNGVYWRLRSKITKNGGDSWESVEFSPPMDHPDLYYFDPMTAYDEVNNIMYAGGIIGDYSNGTEYWFYTYRWEIDSNIIHGPFIHGQNSDVIDKGFFAVDQQGSLWMVEHFGLWKSENKGEHFELFDFHQSNNLTLSPHIYFDDKNCLRIQTSSITYGCFNGSNTQIVPTGSRTFSSLTLGEYSQYLPGTFRSLDLVSSGVGSDGKTYLVYPDLKTPVSKQVVIWMTSSDNEGLTWSEPWIVSKNTDYSDQFLPWFKIGENGRMHLMYFDTRNRQQTDNSNKAWLDVYYSFSDDLGNTWNESRVTPKSLETPELTWGDYFLSDYLSMEITNNQVYLGFPWSEQNGEMNMYLAKTDIEPTQLNDVTYDLNGSWYYPEHSGQGINIEIIDQNNRLFGYWYTYDLLGNQSWFVIDGTIKDQIVNFSIASTSDGIFVDPQTPITTLWGTGTLEFYNCHDAKFTFNSDVELLNGEFPLSRLTASFGNCLQQ